MNMIDKREQEIKNAWELFINQGKLKRDSLRNEIVFAWERSKLYGIDPLLDKIELKAQTDYVLKDDFSINEKMLSDLNDIKSKLCIIDNKGLILNCSDDKNNFFGFEKGKLLEQKITANLSYYSALKKQRADYVLGAEHYLKLFQKHLDTTLLTEINGERYYLLFFVEKKDVVDIVSYAQTLQKLESKWLTEQNNKTLKGQRDSVKIGATTGDGTEEIVSNKPVIENKTKTTKGDNTEKSKIDNPITKNEVKASIEPSINLIARDDKNNLREKTMLEIDLLLNEKYNLFSSSDNIKQKEYLSLLLVGNRAETINKTVYNLLASSELKTKIITINFLFLKTYNLQFDLEPWYQSLYNCIIVFDHIEVLKNYDSDQLLAEIKIANNFLEERKINIIAISYQERALPRNFKKKLNKSFKKIEYYYTKIESDKKTSLFKKETKKPAVNSHRNINKFEEIDYEEYSEKEKKWDSKDKTEINTIKRAIKAADNNMTAVAKQLGISRSTLYRRLKKYQIKIIR